MLQAYVCFLNLEICTKPLAGVKLFDLCQKKMFGLFSLCSAGNIRNLDYCSIHPVL